MNSEERSTIAKYVTVAAISISLGVSLGRLSNASCGDDLIHLSKEVSEMSKRTIQLANLVTFHSDLRFKCAKELDKMRRTFE